jgi:hypothetical protein
MTLPPDARLVAVIDHAGKVIEQQLHEMFRAYRVHGEWFERCPELDALIAVHAVE